MSVRMLKALACFVVLFAAASGGPLRAAPRPFREMPMPATFTKSTDSFQVKNVFPFQIPQNANDTVNFRGFGGSLSIIASDSPKFNKDAFSETLFIVVYMISPHACPKQGEAEASYAAMSQVYPNKGLGAFILKQAHSGKETLNVDINLPVGTPVHIIPGGCVFISFDGTDFAGRPYTMQSNLTLRYDTETPVYKNVQSAGLDAEFLISPSNYRSSTLNAYSVIPVSEKSDVHPGKLLSVYGDVSAISSIGFAKEPVRKGRWFVRHVFSVYKNGSCQRAFPGHAVHKFFWNDHTGTHFTPNETSAFWRTSLRIADVTLKGNGIMAVQKTVFGAPSPPYRLEEGDCIVDAVLPYGDAGTSDGGMNTEIQVTAQYVPD